MDIRKPIGQLFLLLGLILVAWGLISGADAKGENLNLVWGSVILVFGFTMWQLARSAAKAESSCGCSGCGCSKSE